MIKNNKPFFPPPPPPPLLLPPPPPPLFALPLPPPPPPFPPFCNVHRTTEANYIQFHNRLSAKYVQFHWKREKIQRKSLSINQLVIFHRVHSDLKFNRIHEKNHSLLKFCYGDLAIYSSFLYFLALLYLFTFFFNTKQTKIKLSVTFKVSLKIDWVRQIIAREKLNACVIYDCLKFDFSGNQRGGFHADSNVSIRFSLCTKYE